MTGTLLGFLRSVADVVQAVRGDPLSACVRRGRRHGWRHARIRALRRQASSPRRDTTSGCAPANETSPPSVAGTIFTRLPGTANVPTVTASRAGSNNRSPWCSAMPPPTTMSVGIEQVDEADDRSARTPRRARSISSRQTGSPAASPSATSRASTGRRRARSHARAGTRSGRLHRRLAVAGQRPAGAVAPRRARVRRSRTGARRGRPAGGRASPAVPSGPRSRLAAAHDGAPEPRRHGDVDEVVAATRHAVGQLGERGDVRVALKERGQAQALFHLGGHRQCRGTRGRGSAG